MMIALLAIGFIALCVFGIAYVSYWTGYRTGYNKGWHIGFDEARDAENHPTKP